MDAEDAPPPPDLPDWCFEEEVKKGPYYNLFTVSHLFLNRQALMTMESPLWRQMELVGAMALGGKGGMGVEKDLEGGRGESSWKGCQEFPISPYRWELCWKHCWTFLKMVFFLFPAKALNDPEEGSKSSWMEQRFSWGSTGFHGQEKYWLPCRETLHGVLEGGWHKVLYLHHTLCNIA